MFAIDRIGPGSIRIGPGNLPTFEIETMKQQLSESVRHWFRRLCLAALLVAALIALIWSLPVKAQIQDVYFAIDPYQRLEPSKRYEITVESLRGTNPCGPVRRCYIVAARDTFRITIDKGGVFNPLNVAAKMYFGSIWQVTYYTIAGERRPNPDREPPLMESDNYRLNFEEIWRALLVPDTVPTTTPTTMPPTTTPIIPPTTTPPKEVPKEVPAKKKKKNE